MELKFKNTLAGFHALYIELHFSKKINCSCPGTRDNCTENGQGGQKWCFEKNEKRLRM